MRTISTYILRALWLLLLFARIWNLAAGRAAHPLHQFNVILTAAVLIGALAIWFSAPRAKILSSICGVVAAVMMAFQFWVMMSMFTLFNTSSDIKIQYQASFGPFRFDGIAAQLITWLPLLLLLVLSAVLFFSEIRSGDSDV